MKGPASLGNNRRAHGLMPFVIDDIPVDFEDNRAAARIRIPAGLPRKARVIPFARRKHLIEMAEG